MAGKRHAHREAQRRYRQTPKGKKAHREAENRRRYGLSQKKMDDGTSTGLYTRCNMHPVRVQSILLRSSMIGRCHFCGTWGMIAQEFPRRGYGCGKQKGQMV